MDRLCIVVCDSMETDLESTQWELDVVELRKLIAKVYEEIARAPPYNEVMNENEATEFQKYQARKRQRLSQVYSAANKMPIGSPNATLRESKRVGSIHRTSR